MPGLRNYRNQRFFAYDGRDTILKSNAGKIAVTDWNRQIVDANGQLNKDCIYYINGIKLSDIRAQMLENGECEQLRFSGRAELRRFFRTHLFQNLSLNEARIAAEHASLQFAHGIQHATYYYLGEYAQQHFPNLKFSEPEMTVHFDSTLEGVQITEHNKYREWVEVRAKGAAKKHRCSAPQEPYAESRTICSFTPKNIILKDLIIDCPSDKLVSIFAQQPDDNKKNGAAAFWKAILKFSALFSFFSRCTSGHTEQMNEQPKDIICYKHPRFHK
ncbi:MAG: hypothetical protein NTU48_06695 [Legionellales bacterium]|nr:hypothetical protein [Legionellales bacterium]